MKYRFYKYHGCGNDYIYFDASDGAFPPEEIIPALCNRHTGIGGDGVVFILPSLLADGRMVMYNMDGSRGNICGNALRCVASHLRSSTYPSIPSMAIETDSGIIPVTFAEDGPSSLISCKMQAPSFEPENIPAASQKKLIDEPWSTPFGPVRITCLSMGNPHCVFFRKDLKTDFLPIATYLSSLPLFPEGVNVEAATETNDGEFRFRVLERGSGETLSCGSGACAVAAAAVATGRAGPGQLIPVTSMGGTLRITVTDHYVLMTGPAQKVFTGVIDL